MKIDILKPSSQFALPDGCKALCLTQLNEYAIIGTSRGQVLAYHADRLNHPPIESLVSKAAITRLAPVGTSASLLAISNQATVLTLRDGLFSLTTVLPDSAGARLAVCSPTFIVIAVKKELIIYTHSGNVVARLPVKEKVRLLCQHDSSHIVVASSAVLYKLSLESFELTEIHIDRSLLSSSYFGSSSLDVFACESSITFVQDTLVVFFDTEGHQIRRIHLVEKPVAIGFVDPIYMVVIYGNIIEVYARTSGIRLQTIQSTSLYTCGSVTSTNILLGMNRCLSYFSVYSLEQQIDHCMLMSGSSEPAQLRLPQNDLLISGLDMALQILQHVAANEPFFNYSLKKKFLMIRDIYGKKALILFLHYHKYHDLLVGICSPWLIPVGVILDWFPDILNAALILGFDRGSERSLPRSGSDIRNVSGPQAILWRDSKDRSRMTKPIIKNESGSRVNESDKNSVAGSTGNDNVSGITSENELDPHEVKPAMSAALAVPLSNTLSGSSLKSNPQDTCMRFFDAVTDLIVYLTDQRRVHLNFLQAPDKVHDFQGFRLSAHDLYNVENLSAYLKNMTIAIDTSLFLCYYYVKPMLLGPFLRLGNNHCDASVVTRTLLAEQRLTSEMLDFYFTRELDEEALKTLRVIASSESSEHSQATQLTINYLQKLDNNKLDVVFEGAAWLFEQNPTDVTSIGCQVFMKDTTTCEGYNSERVLEFIEKRASDLSLPLKYLEWALFENTTVLRRIRDQRLYNEMNSHLAIRYIQANSSSALIYLEGTTEYDPVKVLACVTDECANHLSISALLYERCGDHSKALDILYDQLGDLYRAMEFCQKRYKENPVDGGELWHHLLDQILASKNKINAVTNVSILLGKHGLQMDLQRVLLRLPASFPLLRLQNFILSQYNHRCGSVSDMHIQTNLLRLCINSMYCEKVLEHARCVSINSPETKCSVCHRKLGSTTLAVEPRGDQPCHYACVE